MLSRLLRQFLFFLVHLVVKILVAAQNVYRKLFIKDYSSAKGRVTNKDIQMLLEIVPRQKNRLKHLVVLANSNDHTINDLAQLVIWSLIVGIPYVTFYDVTG